MTDAERQAEIERLRGEIELYMGGMLGHRPLLPSEWSHLWHLRTRLRELTESEEGN